MVLQSGCLINQETRRNPRKSKKSKGIAHVIRRDEESDSSADFQSVNGPAGIRPAVVTRGNGIELSWDSFLMLGWGELELELELP